LIGKIIDNHIPFIVSTYSDDDGNETYDDFYFYYEIDSGKIISVNICNEDGTEINSGLVYGETESMFLVGNGLRFIESCYEGIDGETIPNNYYSDYALITKEDFWNSRAVFYVFDDEVHT